MNKYFISLLALYLIITCGRPDAPEDSTATFTLLSTCSLKGYAYDIDVVGAYAYIADGQAGLQIIDITDPESTYVVGEYITSKTAQGVAIRDTLAYVTLASSEGLLILNIAIPSACSLIGTDPGYTEYRICTPPGTYYAYIAAHDFFIIENCSIPQFPFYDKRIPTPGDARGVAIYNDVAYVACEQMGIYMYDISRPDSVVTLLGSQDTPSNAQNVFVQGNYAYVADGRAGLIIIDVQNISEPVIVGAYDTPEYANDVFVVGELAYVADGDGGLQVIDVSDPEMPFLYGEMETMYANAIFVDDTLIYIADRDLGLLVIDEEEE